MSDDHAQSLKTEQILAMIDERSNVRLPTALSETTFFTVDFDVVMWVSTPLI